MLKIEKTNSPTIIKFVSEDFLVRGSYEYKNIDEAKNSPLAQQLFYLPFIKSVYFSGNFIALERYSIVEWEDVEQELLDKISEYIKEGLPLVNEEQQPKKQPVTLYIESTPNPSVMKFVANKKLVDNILEYQNIDEAKHSPLAQELFKFAYVKEVFFDNNYISVMKYEHFSWDEILQDLREFIRNYLAEGKEVVSFLEQVKPSENENLDEFSKKIVNILDEYVRPAVSSDGGNIQFIGYNADLKQVKVLLQGACSGCPSSKMTLKNGIENMLHQLLGMPELRVEAVNG